jgi:peptidoglycan/xylan/chitin deacetylase (PgdA/CDA1 family)/GT2 family glycosyltransferase
MMHKHSVIIACLNGAATLGEALDSLAGQKADVDWEILFVDNGSTDASLAIFEAFAAANPRIPTRVIGVAGNRGKANALNVAIPQAGERLLFLDADDVVGPGWLAAMAAALDRHPLVAARLEFARLNSPDVQATRRQGEQKTLHRLPHAPHCTHAGGATLGFHRRVFETVGPFDPRFAALEDTDWCVRAHLKGFRIVFIPKAVYHYRFRDRPDAIFRQSYAYAKHMMLLRRLYAGEKPSGLHAAVNRASWALRAAGLRASAALARLRGDASFVAAARRASWLGTALGTLAGAREYGAAPERCRFGGTAGRIKRRLRESLLAVAGLLWPTTFSVRTGARAMALTFDDGPDPEWTPLLLDRLKAVGAKATFFLIGSRALGHPDLVARIRAEGHEIGNHSWSHPSLPTLSAQDVAEQLRRARDALGDAGGRLMRPPYGDETFETNRVARSMGYRVTLWSVNGCDWLDDDADTLSRRILAAAHPGAIVLLHDSLQTFEAEAYRDRTPTIDAVETVVRALPGWRFVTVSDLIALGRPVARGWIKRTSKADLAALGRADQPPGGLSAT